MPTAIIDNFSRGEGKSKGYLTLAILCAAMAALPSLADTYAYKVEYLQSSGAQYIDTGVVPTSNTMVRVKYEYLTANGSYDMIAGCTSQRYYPVSLSTTDPLKERHVYNGTAFSDVQIALTTHTVEFNDAQHRVYKDGRLVTTYSQTFSTTRKCFLFASNDGGKPNYYSTARIYWCEFVDTSTDEVLRRFIPVVDESGRPAMFDEVNETLYYNLGTGDDLIAGPREGVEKFWYFVEYLEADGNQWIDTGYLATSNTHTDVGYKFTAETQTSLAMIAGSQSPKYYPVSLNSADAKTERYCYSNNDIFASDYPALQHHEVVFHDATRNVFVDGLWKGAITKSFGESLYTMCMFATRLTAGGVGYKSKSRIWHLEIYEKDVLQRAFLPAVALDGNGNYVPCMHESMCETNHFNMGTGSFAVGRIISSEVPLKLAARGITPSDGLKVLAFSERPSYGTVFTVDEAYANDFDAAVLADGVYTVAKGTGGDEANVITVTGSTSAQFATNAMPVCASIVLRDTITLATDCDWTGLGTLVIPDGVTINLNGHKLHLAGFTCLPDSTVVITDLTDGNGELHVTVAENDVLLNGRVMLAGSLRLVKHGAGVFVASKMQQSYTGGTDVDGGVLRIGNKDKSSGYRNELGAAVSEVRIGDGAELAITGYVGHEFNYTFDGGTLTSVDSPKNDHRQVGDTVTLAGDATLKGKNMGFIAGGWNPMTINMNGNTLHVNLDATKVFTFCNATFTGEGTVSGTLGWVKIASNPCVGTNLTLQFPVTSGGLWLDKNFTVSNFVSHCYSYHKGGDNTALTVLGTFTPAERGRTAFPNMILANGSTLDLSQMSDVPTLTNTCTQVDGTTTHTRTISFENNATINVKLGDRRISKGVPIVGWTEPPENIGNVTFKLVDGNGNAAIVKKNDGLYLTTGLVIIVR